MSLCEGNPCRIFCLIVGLQVYFADIATDILVAIDYFKTCQWWWFGWTITFIILSYFIVTIAGAFQVYLKQKNDHDPFSLSEFLKYFVPVPIPLRFWRQICKQFGAERCISENCDKKTCQKCKKWEEITESAYKLAWLVHIETITESAPQWCLQVYIMLRQWRFPLISMLSAGFSLLSIAWSITSLERARIEKNGKKVNWLAIFLFLAWQLSAIVSRLSAITYFVYVLRVIVFSFVLVHWILSAMCLPPPNPKSSRMIQVVTFFLVSSSQLFYTSEPLLRVKDKDAKPTILKMNFSLTLQNLLMLCLSLAFHCCNDTIKLIALSCVLGGLVLGTVLFMWYFRSCRPTRTEPEAQRKDETENKESTENEDNTKTEGNSENEDKTNTKGNSENEGSTKNEGNSENGDKTKTEGNSKNEGSTKTEGDSENEGSTKKNEGNTGNEANEINTINEANKMNELVITRNLGHENLHLY